MHLSHALPGLTLRPRPVCISVSGRAGTAPFHIKAGGRDWFLSQTSCGGAASALWPALAWAALRRPALLGAPLPRRVDGPRHSQVPFPVLLFPLVYGRPLLGISPCAGLALARECRFLSPLPSHCGSRPRPAWLTRRRANPPGRHLRAQCRGYLVGVRFRDAANPGLISPSVFHQLSSGSLRPETFPTPLC